MMVHRPWYFLGLFVVSAVFWWFFEYLNRFVQNWYYVGGEFNAGEYFLYATLPFSTVLPAYHLPWFSLVCDPITMASVWHLAAHLHNS